MSAGEELRSYRRLLAWLGLLTVVLFAMSLLIGPAQLHPFESIDALISGRGEATALVMREIRLPRALLGLMIGAVLGLSGAALQGYLRNPLAEPGVMGVSAAASFGAVLSIHTGFASLFALALPIGALLGAGAAAAVVMALARVGRAAHEGSDASLILAGVAVSSLAGALTSLALNFSSNPFAVLEIVFWMLGSLADRSMEHVWLAAPFMAVGAAMLAVLGRSLDALTLGAQTAQSLGVRVARVRFMAVAGTALTVGAATAVAGAIGFIGLVAPHLLRPLVGARPSRLLAASALGGAALLLAADIAARLISPEQDLKLGVLTALIGAPFFLRLILRSRTGMV